MRIGLRVHSNGFVGGTDLRLIEVKSATWREYWFVSKNLAPDSYTLDCYLSEADAIAQTNAIASAAHAASVGGDVLAVPMVSTGAPFDPTPMTVLLTCQGTWTLARLAWTHDITGILVDRIRDLIEQYRGPNEMLADVKPTWLGHGLPKAMPSCGVSSGAVTFQGGLGAQLMQDEIQIELHAWAARLDNDLAYKDAMRYGSALIAIAEEQRTWAGLAADTRVAPPAQITIEPADGGGLLYHALVVLFVRFDDLTGTRTATSDDYATGGKYAAAVA